MNEKYKQLMSKFKEIVLLSNVYSSITWDYEVMMPKKGIKQRSDEMALMSGLIHERSIDPNIGKLLKELNSEKVFGSLDDFQQRNVTLLHRDYEKEINVPIAFAKELSKHGALCTQKWKEAKSKADYSIFRNDLEKMIELKKQHAAYLNPDKDPYDVLLDNYEFGFNKVIYDKIFKT